MKQKLFDAIDAMGPAYAQLSDAIWDTPELAFEEYQSSALQAAMLEQEGFQITRGLAGIPTAFVGERGSGGPVIGFLGEFDALAGMDQDAGVAVRQSSNPSRSGHGCGHNLHGVGAMLAAVALANLLKQMNLPGTVRYYGCPAEEGGSGKVYMVRDGVFDDLDIALNWHPNTISAVKAFPALAVIRSAFRFHGRAAHAAAAPHLGRSALDAVELTSVGVNYLREHMPERARVHYAVTDAGGSSPGVVQARAEVSYVVRSPDIHEAKALYERVHKIAQGAALMTETTLEARSLGAVSNILYNKVLDEVMAANVHKLGAPPFDEADVAFAEEIKKSFTRQEIEFNARCFGFAHEADKALSDDLVASGPQHGGGSSDMGDVSWVVPTGQYFGACYAMGTDFHTWQLVAQGKTAAAHKGMIHAAKVLAATAVDLIEQPELIVRAKAALDETTRDQPYSCPLPADLQPPLKEH